jgi:mono/diheme cytochrome c family protein
MKASWKKILKGVGAILGVGFLAGGAYVFAQTSAFDASMAKVYDVPLPTVARSSDAAVLARGKHLAESVAPCATRQCHGADMGGGETLSMGPLGTLTGPNLTTAIAGYTDAELARMLRHGLKKNGQSLAFMPVQDFGWLPDDDVAAVVSYVRTVPVVGRPSAPLTIGTLGKVLDRQGKIVFDVARHIDHTAGARPKGATPTVEYGQYLAMSCTGCHGERLSGGPLPGAPPSVPTPLNLTPHESGLKDWTRADFDALLSTGMRKNGKKLDPFMPFEAFGKFDDVERAALWAYLRSVPPLPFGGR